MHRSKPFQILHRSLHTTTASRARLIGDSYKPSVLLTQSGSYHEPPKAPLPWYPAGKPDELEVRPGTPPSIVSPPSIKKRIPLGIDNPHDQPHTKTTTTSPAAGPEVSQASIATFDAFLGRALIQLDQTFPRGTFPDLSTLLIDLERKGNVTLGEALKYEAAPNASRRIVTSSADAAGKGEVGDQSGIVTIAFVLGGTSNPRVSFSTGFKVGETESGEGDKIITCSHTLLQMSPHLSSSTATPSAIFIITSTSHIYPVASLLSSLPRSDLMLLQLAPEPLRDPNYALQNASTTSPSPYNSKKSATRFVDDMLAQVRDKARLVPSLRSLPISPYPPPKGTGIAALVYRHPVATASAVREGDIEGIEWEEGMIVEYLDSEGAVSETGSYDELAALSITTLPKAGSSGSPIIDTSTGAVIGVVRGNRHSYGDRCSRGFGVPSEKIFEFFELPGFVQKKK